MDLTCNTIPKKVKTIHMIAACGTGMGALACMLMDLGYEVTGSDCDIYPPMSEFLLDRGIRLFKGFQKDHLDHHPDLVIIGNAVVRENPEAQSVMERGIFYCSMPQALNHFVAKEKKILLITGTHGKTTTASILAHLLNEAGLDPSFFIGGILKNFNSNYHLGSGDYMVIEGDEYDTAFFDKGPKFMHYNPFITIMTGIEFDHADIFRDLDHIKTIFEAFIKGLSNRSLILACKDNSNLRQVLQASTSRIQTYGDSDADWAWKELVVSSDLSKFKVVSPKKKVFNITSRLMGGHNTMNSIAAFAAARSIGVDVKCLVPAFKTFDGIKRRQEVRGIKNGITVMDDFAHHPTAVRETIAAVKPFYKNGRIIAVFEPRTNSSMRDIFQQTYPTAFDEADLVCLRSPSKIDKIPVPERLSSQKLLADIRLRGVTASLFEDTDQIIAFLKITAEKGDLVLIMSNGGFDNIHSRLIETL